MEGLIPMALRALKKNKIRRKYRCLSVGPAQTYQISDFYDDHYESKLYTPQIETRGGLQGRRTSGHRRYASAGEYGFTGGYDFNYDHHHDDDEVNGGGAIGMKSSPPSKQIIKRYRSHRMFSCITGTI